MQINTDLINFMAEDTAPPEIGRQQEQESPTPSQERKHLSKEERQQALAARIQESYGYALPTDSPNVIKGRLKLNIEDRDVTQDYFPTRSEYEIATDVEGRMLPKEERKEIADYVTRITNSTMMQCPEYRAGIAEMRDQLDPMSIFDRYTQYRLFAGDFTFNRGDLTVRFNGGDTDFSLVVREGPVTERVFCENNERRSALNYQRSEIVGDSVSFLHEYDTEETLAGVEQVLERIREAGVLSRDIPDGLYKSKEAVWKRILDQTDIRDLVVKATTLGGTVTMLANNPSILHAIGTGTAAAIVGYDTWKKAGNYENALRTEAESIIDMGELEWGHFRK